MQIRIQAAKRTRLGRALCRLAGDQTGAVMMEYVILGVLVAAAAVLGVTFFGKQIVGGFRVMISAVAGKNEDAKTTANDNQTASAKDQAAAETSRKAIAPSEQ